MRQVATCALFCLLIIQPLGARGVDEPDNWREIGTVREWMEWDSRFYRLLDANPYQDSGHHGWDQERIWNASKDIRALNAEALSLAEFAALTPEQQKTQHLQAAGDLAYVARLRNMELDRLQRARENLPTESLDTSDWPLRVTEILQKLKAAVAMEPTNYYAWHLRGYFLACCGDVAEAHRNLEMAAEALGALGETEHLDMKRRVQLDLAWLERNQGLPGQAAGRLEVYHQLGKATVESRLLEGLVAVLAGQDAIALEKAGELATHTVYRFPTSYQSAALVPEVIDVQRWEKVDSGYLRDWLTALVALRDGDAELARLNFPELSVMRYYPFAQYFWNDAAMIFDRTGRFEQAEQARTVAGLSRPWFYYLTDRPYGLRLGRLAPGGGLTTCYVGYNRFYQAGSRLAFGALLTGSLPAIEDPAVKQAQAAEALDQLEICQRTDHYPGQAGILKGQVYYLMGDYQSAITELKHARGLLMREGDEDNLARVRKDLEVLELNMNRAGMKDFFAQSGASQGRWDALSDPAATEQELRAQVEANPADEKARLELARHLIRNGDAAAGRSMAMALYRPGGHNDTNRAVVTLALEADRTLGQTEMADAMLRHLDKGRGDEWPDANLWSLVGTICQDHGRPEDARRALETALRMDPDNRGLQNLLKMMN